MNETIECMICARAGEFLPEAATMRHVELRADATVRKVRYCNLPPRDIEHPEARIRGGFVGRWAA